MITPNGDLRCDNCGRQILLHLEMIEGTAKFYCPSCRFYQEIYASTAQVTKDHLTKEINNARVNFKVT